MRVALDVSAIPSKVAGVGRYVMEMAVRLPGRDVATTLVTRHGDGDRWRLASPRATLSSVVPDGRAARLAYEAWWLGRGAAAAGVDLWHAPHYTMPHRRLRPTAVTIHDLTFFTNPEWHERSKVSFFRQAIRYSATQAQALLCVSEFSARMLDEIIPTHAPVVVTPLGVDLARFDVNGARDEELFVSHDLPPSTPYVLFVGTLEPRKGIDVLLEAFVTLARADESVELWLAGQSGWGVAPMKAALAAHPYASRIRRLGYVDDEVLPALYRRAGAVAYPSRGEGFGLPVLEAMACGASVVTTRDTVMAELAGDAARLVAVGAADELAVALAAARDESADDRARRAAASRARAETFSWDRCVEAHLGAYRLALG